MRNHANDMIDWTADERGPADVSVEKVLLSDLVILLVAHWYGSSPPEESRSFTEIEYDAAKSRDIPVLVFLADPRHPWPPALIESDPQRMQKLASFKARLNAERTRVLFSTQDSLTAFVTQAVANFDIRTHAVEVNDAETLAEPLRERAAVISTPDLLLGIGDAEDGLPLAIRIVRTQHVQTDIRSLAEHIGLPTNSPFMADVSRLSVEAGRRAWTTAGVHDVQWKGAISTRCYVAYKNLTAFFAPSVLTRALAAIRGVAPDYGGEIHRRESTHATAVSARNGVDDRIESRGGSNRYLALDLSCTDVHVVGWREIDDEKQVVGWRTFMNETIRSLEVHSYEIRRQALGSSKVASNSSGFDYEHALAHLLRQSRFDDNVRFGITVHVARQSLGAAVCAAAMELAPLHRAGRLHGDLKPQNMLVTDGGVVLIDNLNLAEGEVAPALSPTWASPEQILLRPLTVASDVHALGLMLTALIGGELAGEQATYVLPSETAGVVRIPFIKDPVVYLNPRSRVIDKASRAPWLDFVEACLRSNPAARPSPAETFAQQLGELLAMHPLRGTVPLGVMPNSRIELVTDNNGFERPCHVLVDTWSGLRRPLR